MALWPTGGHFRITRGVLKVDTWKAKQAEERKQDLDGITKPHQDLPDASPVPLGFYVSQTKYSLYCLSQP